MKIIQNKIFSILVLFFCVVVFFNLKANGTEKIQLIENNYYINELKLQDFDGNYSYLKDKKADYFLINLWASWCAPCIKEMRSLDMLKKKNKNILVITISEDNEVSEARDFFKKNNYKNLEKYYDFNKDFISKIKVRGLPTTFIANSKYEVFAKVEGAIEWDSKEFIEWLYNN